MELNTIQNRIEEKIKLLEKGRELLRSRSIQVARASSEYEKAVAIAILKIREGVVNDFCGLPVKGLAANLVDRVARGICNKEKYDDDLAQAEYKAAIEGMRAIEAELNGYQSILKYSEYEQN